MSDPRALLHRTERAWAIKVCTECDLPVESCSCDPKDWVDEPPHRTVRVEEVR